jgi:hypothetical protein
VIMLFSIIIPSRGTRPKALTQAISSVLTAVDHALNKLDPAKVEILVGFDGIHGERVVAENNVHYFDLPRDQNWGNGIRNTLLRRAKGDRLIFLDDDNALTPSAFATYLQHMDADMLIARIDAGKAFTSPFLPVDKLGKSLVRQGNIDPLCLCLSRDLVVVRGQGWQSHGKYESDYLNILRYWRRAKSVQHSEDIVGIYDAGVGLDPEGVNQRQHDLLVYQKKSLAGW